MDDKRAITKVVELLEQMLEKSQAEGVTEKELFAKHKCYCDKNEEEKSSEVETLTEEINLLEGKIESTQAGTATLSQELAELSKGLEDNQQQQDEANSLRTQQSEAFVAKEKDLKQAIDQMQRAIKELADVGADQSLNTDTQHTQHMAGFGEEASPKLLALKGVVKQALMAASAIDATSKQAKIDAFLQAPFTEAYSSQAGEVVGILKQMLETFETNLEEATKEEKIAQDAHDKLMTTLQDAAKTMGAAEEEKQGLLGANDDSLGTMKEQLSTAVDERTDASSFLTQLEDICTTKAKEYDQRVKLRTQEEAAISQAIAILNSDAAFATFGKVSATSTGSTGAASFVQLASATAPAASEMVQQAKMLLRKADHGRRSKALSHILALLEAENPFKTVLEEIDKMIALIDDEEIADQAKFDWCEDEREKKNGELTTANQQLLTLKAQMSEIESAIKNEENGLIVTIKNTEDNLASNRDSQQEQTEMRTKDNLAYQQDIATLVEAEDLLTKAVTVLKKYYQEALKDAGSAMLQRRAGSKEDPAPPETWGAYKGQSESGSSAISMVEFILEETKKEEQAAHSAEDEAQQSYEASMQQLKTSEAELGEILAKKQLELAEKREELLGKQEDHKATVKVRDEVEAYLLKIKPGCDFIDQNMQLRKDARKEEKAALESAITLLQETPAFKEAMAEAHEESLGGCADTCGPKGGDAESHVDCKACLAKTSVPGYCAGHPGTTGC